MKFRLALVALAFLAASVAPAYAQDSPDIRRVELAIGSTISVTTADGKTTSGRLGLTSASELVLVDGRDQRRIPWVDIRQIVRQARRASVPKGTLVGLGVGLGVGAVALGTGGCTEDAGTFAGECFLFFGGIGAGAGALTTVIINAVRSPQTIYQSNGPRKLAIAPVVSPNRLGVAGTIRW